MHLSVLLHIINNFTLCATLFSPISKKLFFSRTPLIQIIVKEQLDNCRIPAVSTLQFEKDENFPSNIMDNAISKVCDCTGLVFTF